MNAAESAARLPEPIRRLVAAERSVGVFAETGMSLEDILGDPAWAAEWKAGADPALVRFLGWLLRRFAAVPFTEDKAEETAIRERAFTGAEVRVGLARLRRAGIAFAVRRTWGEKLVYIPSDMVPVWFRATCPEHERVRQPDPESRVSLRPFPFRLPLSLELLTAWSAIARTGFPLTGRGAPAKPAAHKLAASMRLTPEELAMLRLAGGPQDPLPAPAALALDLGLYAGVLERREKEVAVCPAGLANWLNQSPRQADERLHELAAQRYASADPGLHVAASALAACPVGRWTALPDAAVSGISAEDLERWLDLLVSFGWAERGDVSDQPVFRLLSACGSRMKGTAEEAEPEAAEPCLVLPDGEIYAPPGFGLAGRWRLEQIADRVTADRVFVYKLTKGSAARAHRDGWDLDAVLAALQEDSGEAVPDPVREALGDWFGGLGKARFEEAVLLRAADERTARLIAGDAEASALIREAAGGLIFLVDRPAVKPLAARLDKLGLTVAPPGAPEPLDPRESRDSPGSAASARRAAGESAVQPEARHRGWFCLEPVLPFHEPDRSLPGERELFPGRDEVPKAWLERPAAYHVSTRKELVRRAIGWRTALRLGEEGSAVFVPNRLLESGEAWEVSGYWNDGGGSPSGETTLGPGDLGSLMIALPPGNPAD